MPFVLIVAGVILLISAVRGTHQELYYLVAGDFLGPNNFIYWFLSIVLIGAIGYIPKMKPISDGFLILVILVLFLKKGDPKGMGGGFFDQFQKQIAGTTTAKPVVSKSSTGASNAVDVGGGGVTVTPPSVGVKLPGVVRV